MARGRRKDGERPRQLPLFPAPPARLTAPEVQARFEELNRRHFGGELPRPSVRFSTRMLRAGAVYLDRRELVISVPYHDAHGWDAELVGTLKHEMIHMWLHARGRSAAHTPEFHALCRRVGAPRYCRPFGREYKYLYRCARGHEVRARRKLPGHSCARCSRRYDPRFPLRIVRVLR